MKQNSIGSLIGGRIVTLVGVEILGRERLIKDWKDYGYGFKRKFSNYQFINLIKMGINGELR